MDEVKNERKRLSSEVIKDRDTCKDSGDVFYVKSEQSRNISDGSEVETCSAYIPHSKEKKKKEWDGSE